MQYLRPATDIALGAWSVSGATTASGALGEATANDSTTVGIGSGQSRNVLEVRLGAGSAPVAGTRTLTIRSRFNGAFSADLEGPGTPEVELRDGGTTLWSSRLVSLSGSFGNESFDVTSVSISDWSNLRLRFYAPNVTNQFTLSQAFLELPDGEDPDPDPDPDPADIPAIYFYDQGSAPGPWRSLKTEGNDPTSSFPAGQPPTEYPARFADGETLGELFPEMFEK